MSDQQVLESWDIHNRINLYLLDAIDEAYLKDTGSGKGRSVAEQFAHIHNVRLMWFKASEPELLKGLEKVEKTAPISKELLVRSLTASGAAVRTLLESALADGGRLKGFKPHVYAFLGYMISHESHHRGQLVITLKQSNHPLDKKVLYGMWEWGVR